MPTSDLSASTRTLHKGARVLAEFKAVADPRIREQGPERGTDQSTVTTRRPGAIRFVIRTTSGSTVQEDAIPSCV